MVKQLHEELWLEILKRLPTESLFRFRPVCERWNSIITSSFFINLYFTFNLSATPANLKPYFDANYVPIGVYLDTDGNLCASSEPCLALNHYDNNQQKHHFPFQVEVEGRDRKLVRLVDVVHGVLCIFYTLSLSLGNPNFAFHWTFLWNPSIHKYIALPRLIVTRFDLRGVGFGYDASKDDFKVIVVYNRWGGGENSNNFRWGGGENSNNLCWFDVYSARQGFWRSPLAEEIRVEKTDEWVLNNDSCFVNGTIHWLIVEVGSGSVVYSVLMFDCESEKVRTMDIPELVLCWSKSVLDLFEYADMLAISVRSDEWDVSMNIWVMEEHGVTTSWKKIYTLNQVLYPDLGCNDCEIIMNDPSFKIEKRVPYVPNNQWEERYQILRNRVYNKSMFLMDHPNAQSYTNQDAVHV